MSEDGPIAWWRLGDPIGSGEVADAVGTRHGTLIGSVELGAPGAIAGDTAATFDGNSLVQIGNHFGSGDGSAFSIEAWIARRGGSDHHFSGSIDEVAIYDYALPSARVQAHYLAGTGQGP